MPSKHKPPVRGPARRKAFSAVDLGDAAFRCICESAREGILVVELESKRFRYCNAALAGMFGYEPDDMLQLDLGRIHPAEAMPEVERTFRELVQGALDSTIQPCLRKDGTVFTAQIHASITEVQGCMCVAGFFQDVSGQQHAGEVLRHQAMMLDMAPTSITIHDTAGRFLYANQATFDLHGYTREEFMALSLGRLDAPESAGLFEARVDELKCLGKAAFEVSHVRKDGSEFPLKVFARIIDWDGQPVILSVAADITERKKAEAVADDHRRNLESLFHAIHESVALIDRQHVLLAVNKTFVSRLGRTVADCVGRVVYDLIPPETASRRKAIVEEVLQTGKPVVFEDERQGLWMQHSLYPVVNQAGVVDRVAIYAQDITAKKQAEMELAESHRLLSNLARLVPGVVYQFRLYPDGRSAFPYASVGMHDIFEVTPEVVREDATPLLGRLHPDDVKRVVAAVQASEQTLQTFICEFRVLLPRQGLRWRWSQAQPERLPDGSTLWHGIISDITGRKESEAREAELHGRLERSARMESLGVLAGGVAHDLNNVLGPLVILPDLVSEYIERHGDPADLDHEDMLESLRTIKQSARRAVGVVSDLVVMGRRGQFQQAPVDVNRVIRQMLDSKQVQSLRAMRPDIQVVCHLADEAVWCRGSDSRLMRVLTNLVGNAVEAIDGQGDVIIRTGRRVLVEPFNGYEVVPAGSYVTIEVADTGCGMAADTLARIFEPFFSTKAPGYRSGSGLGLSVVHGLIRDHAGFLDVRSAPGRGTMFMIFLPEVKAGAVTERSGDVALPGGTERILVVDDEPGQQVLARRQLKRLGYEATVVPDGEAAITLFESARRENRPSPFDLVMMDMIMKGLDGVETCRAILRLYPDQKLMIVSGHAPDKLELQARMLGADWLAKPYLAADLARALRTRLDR